MYSHETSLPGRGSRVRWDRQRKDRAGRAWAPTRVGIHGRLLLGQDFSGLLDNLNGSRVSRSAGPRSGTSGCDASASRCACRSTRSIRHRPGVRRPVERCARARRCRADRVNAGSGECCAWPMLLGCQGTAMREPRQYAPPASRAGERPAPMYGEQSMKRAGWERGRRNAAGDSTTRLRSALTAGSPGSGRQAARQAAAITARFASLRLLALSTHVAPKFR